MFRLPNAITGGPCRQSMEPLTMSRLSLIAAAAALTLVATPAFAGSGSFRGASGHVTKGSVSVTKSGNKLVIKLGKNFFLDGAPDPYVALGNGSKPLKKGGLIAVLRKNKGSQTYSANASSALSKATHAIIWCKKFAVPLGVARLK